MDFHSWTNKPTTNCHSLDGSTSQGIPYQDIPYLDRKMHQDPDRDRYSSDEEGTVTDNAAEELELIAVSKRPTRLLPHGTVVRTNLEPSVQEATPLNKIWCVKLMDDAHAPEKISGQLNVVNTYLKEARYRLSDLLRAQRNDRMTSNLKR